MGEKLVSSAVSQRANVMLTRFKVNTIAHGEQTVNVLGHYVRQQVWLASQPFHCPQIINKFHEKNGCQTFVLSAAA